MADIVSLIEELENRRYQAMIDADLATLEELCSDDLVYTHSNGERDTKSSYLDKVESRFFQYHWIEHPIESLATTDDCAVLTGQMRASVLNNGERRQLDNAFLAVWIKGAEGWRFVAYQPTPNSR